MKWDYDVETLRDFYAKDGRIDGDVVEALRAIAEQLERIADRWDTATVGAVAFKEDEELSIDRDDSGPT